MSQFHTNVDAEVKDPESKKALFFIFARMAIGADPDVMRARMYAFIKENNPNINDKELVKQCNAMADSFTNQVMSWETFLLAMKMLDIPEIVIACNHTAVNF